jgi:hypothetical protein
MVAKSRENFESAERYWSGKPSLASVDAIVERMKARRPWERLEICRPKPSPKDWQAQQGQEAGE